MYTDQIHHIGRRTGRLGGAGAPVRRGPVRALTFGLGGVALACTVALAPSATSAGPTCAGLGALQNHGQHVVGDYVTGTGGIDGTLAWPPAGQVGGPVGGGGGAAVPGGPGPGFHFPAGFAPGASFCLMQSQSPGIHLDIDHGH